MTGMGEPLVFLHGWGHNSANLRPLATEFIANNRYIIDLPGFGNTPEPDTPMTVEEYAKAIADWIIGQNLNPWIIGHSFGGKIAMEIAASRPDLIRGIIVIGGAGFVTLRSRLRRIIFRPVVKFIRMFGSVGAKTAALFQSTDYRNASGMMRRILSQSLRHKTIDAAREIRIPTLLIYGSNDIDTPPSFGRKFARAIPGAKLEILHGFEHNDILTTGRFQVSGIIKRFIK